MVTESVGQGHNTVAAALADALGALHPDCQVHLTNTFGPRTGTFVRRLYHVAVQLAPALHELWYRAVCRSTAVRWVYGELVGAARCHAQAATRWVAPHSSRVTGWSH